MEFESLPHEIFIECFQYLNIFDLFHSFNRLNSRFHQLIRCVSNSLRLSNKNHYCQIKRFLSHFSPTDLHRLYSLTLIHLQRQDLLQLKSLLPSITKLTFFHLISPQIDDEEILSILPKSNLQKLTLVALRSFLIHTRQPTLITHLTITRCSLEQLSSQLFQYVPSLKYLNIEHIKKHDPSAIECQTLITAVYLKQLIIGQLNYSLEDLSNFVRQTPNLQSLTISSNHNLSMINANKWEDLITTSLPRLKIFQFKFLFKVMFLHTIFSKYKLFHRQFWFQQHEWLAQCLCDDRFVYIHTLPYLSNRFQLESKMYDLTYVIFPDAYQFDNVKNLSLNLAETTNERLFRFPNVISLKLVTSTLDLSEERLRIESLKIMVGLANVKHLDIFFNAKVILSGALLEILKESSQLSSIIMYPDDLALLYHDKELCRYLKQKIRKLNLHKYARCSWENLSELKRFCQVFSHIEHLICNIEEPKYVLFLLYRLANLTNLHVYFSTLENRRELQTMLANTSRKFRLGIRVNALDVSFRIGHKAD